MSRWFVVMVCLGWVAGFGGWDVTHGQETVAPQEPYRDLAEGLERWIDHEIEQKGIPSLSIALVDDQHLVWARGFGLADPKAGVPATAETVYRVGSVSKLFTDLAAMRMVEQGLLDLDEPIETYLPEFQPRNPFETPITLRQLMSHRSGLVRESPVGHYFDPNEPTLAETVLSLNDTELVYPPQERTKYSNAAVSVVGLVVERVAGEPFEALVQRTVFEPLQLQNSAFLLNPELEARLSKATMWTLEGREFDAPTFALGTLPAGNLYSTVLDLGSLLSVLFAEGEGPTGAILKPDLLEQMLTPQFDEQAPFGLGFALSNWEGHRRLGHGGAVYGFSTEFAGLPDEKLGVVVASSRDVTNTVVRRIADAALEGMRAVRIGAAIPEFPVTAPLDSHFARQVQGRYELDGKGVELTERNGRLYLQRLDGGDLVELRCLGEDLIVDDRLDYGLPVRFEGEEIRVGKETFPKVERLRPEPPPDSWRGLIGEYGWEHNILYILEREGKLHALIEWFFLYPLEEIDPNTFAFPETGGLYHGEHLIFQRDATGRATEVEAASVRFERRNLRGEDGSTFQIEPVRPVSELRPLALEAQPPEEAGQFRPSELVDLKGLEPSIKLDLRYATSNNFLGTPLYTSARAYLQRPAAEALAQAHQALQEQGFGLLIHDAYRPWHVTKLFWEATPTASRDFVANPANGSRHNRGCAVDLTLFDLESGQAVPMVAGYDEFSDRAHAFYPGGTSLQRWHRDLLRKVMEDQGFSVYEREWWHFDYQDWPEYAIQNTTFEERAR